MPHFRLEKLIVLFTVSSLQSWRVWACFLAVVRQAAGAALTRATPVASGACLAAKSHTRFLMLIIPIASHRPKHGADTGSCLIPGQTICPPSGPALSTLTDGSNSPGSFPAPANISSFSMGNARDRGLLLS